METSPIPVLVFVAVTWTLILATGVWAFRRRKQWAARRKKRYDLSWLNEHHPLHGKAIKQFSYEGAQFGLQLAVGDSSIFNVSLTADAAYLGDDPAALDTHEVARLPQITFTRETHLRERSKAIGLTREHQSGCEEFDAFVFIDTEAPEPLLNELLDDAEVRDHITALLDDGWRAVVLYGVAPVTLQSKTQAPTQQDIHVFQGQLDRALALRATLPKVFLAGKARIALTPGKYAILSSIMLTTVCFIYSMATQWKWPVVDNDFNSQSGELGFFTWMLSMGLLFMVVRGRSDSLRSLSISGVLMLFTLPLGAPSVMRTLNAKFDPSAPVSVQVEVVEREHYTSDDGDTYYLTFGPSPHSPEFRMRVSGALWNQIGEQARLTLRDGALDAQWVESIEPI